MIRNFFIRSFTSLAIIAVGLGGFCPKVFANQSAKTMPMVKAMVMDASLGCSGQKSFETNKNCCITSHSDDSKSTVDVKSGSDLKKFSFTQFNLIKVCFESFGDTVKDGSLQFHYGGGYKSPPSLTGVIVKKE